MLHTFPRFLSAARRRWLLGLSGDTNKVLAADGNEIQHGALVLLEAHTASTSATLDFTAFADPNRFDEYLVEFVGVIPATDNVNFYMRMSTDGGASYDATALYSYSSYVWVSGGAGAGGAAQSAPTNQIDLVTGNQLDSSTLWGLYGQARLFALDSTTAYKRVTAQIAWRRNSDNAHEGGVQAAAYHSTTAVNAIRFLMSSGNIASGTIRIYGIAK